MMWSMIGSSARILLLVIPPFSTFSSEKMIEIVVETNTWFHRTALTLKMWKRLLYKRTCSHRGREYCILPQTPLVFCSTCLSVMNGQSKKLKVPNSPWSIFRVAHHVHPLGLQVGGGLSGVFHGCDLGDIGVNPPGVSGMKRGAQKWAGFLWDGIELWPNQCKTDL